MAKKKKKGEKQGNDDGGAMASNEAGAAPEGALLEQLLAAERIKEMEAKNRTLSQTNASLSAKLAQQQQDQADVFFHLHRKIDQNQETIKSMEEARAVARDEAAAEADLLRAEIKALEKEAKTRTSAHEDEVFALRQELMELNEFAKQKSKYEAKIDSLETALEKESSQRTREVADMELEKVREKERLKQDMLVKIKETKKALLRLTEDQLDTTTKRTILENEQLATELQYQSRETEKLLSRLSTLERDNAVLRRKLDLVHSEKLGHARKANLYWKLSQTLQEYDLEKTLKSTLTELSECLRTDGSTGIANARAKRLRDLVRRRKTARSRDPEPLPVWQSAGDVTKTSTGVKIAAPTAIVFSPTRPLGKATSRRRW
ncbi:Cilia- and flagella-associated protein 157 [Hondaea fermentalgiana]|uniref:Cilia- and flagella-associated protein 157 n=1 Tax=Hondaea fermentalgiana TaxID=2315210 RepID=A0A2R5GVH2_9STRA|nr:Cilia- and flagella-associated protein 157 [Hondaea fermentalgiana]|eukprot:GBG34852.1 Cilia- and flagella-associated protein 157 [Hondaea fermentalgiana]